IRTGSRCTTLTKLPVAFSGGSNASVEPVPMVNPETRPLNTCRPPYMSTYRSTGWPMRKSRSCVSLKLASTQISLSDRSAGVLQFPAQAPSLCFNAAHRGCGCLKVRRRCVDSRFLHGDCVLKRLLVHLGEKISLMNTVVILDQHASDLPAD